MSVRRASQGWRGGWFGFAVAVVAAACSSSVLTGCASRIAFTEQLRHEQQLSDDDVKNLQFYLSHTVTLRRELDESRRRISDDHQLLFTRGKTIDEVVINDDTPGVAIAVGEETLRVSFAEGVSLDFSLRPGETWARPLVEAPSQAYALAARRAHELAPQRGYARPPEPFPADRREPPGSSAGAERSGRFWLLAGPNDETVTLGGRVFAATGDSPEAHLMIETRALDEVFETRTVLEGRKLGQGAN